MSENKLKNLEELPEFESYPFDGKTDIPIYEIARLTYIETPGSNPDSQNQVTVSVVGRSPDANNIYFAPESMLRNDGTIIANHPIKGEVNKCHLERYEVLIPNEKLLGSESMRRI